ncbi:ABC transporter substrate-binding protein [Psychromonas sp. psych-6C06]|uniref:metal ABC transporter solute-binding protein, Zn/Mn family n=1 Tax=Psychromonas sp. psych-6C06 TaxID=2058089 RepID=UPI000C338F46|nr:zinc ABC transporter substrate-binding protein [Psychromonas sp. psych-6C06]PKF63322.1 ABC transporter substrate-binding protein [Psychromonas sp. psych-6C06]
MNTKSLSLWLRLAHCGVLLSLVLPSKILASDILTSTPVTYLLASQLMKNTPITTTYLAPKRYGIERLENWFATKGMKVAEKAAKKATVTVTLKSLWPQDPLFNATRQGNIRLIEIDASQAFTMHTKGVATVQLPAGGHSLYAWLNPNNLGTMMSIVSDDLQRVWPEHATMIEENQQALLLNIRKLINAQQQHLLGNQIDSVILLSNQLEDFASANQLFVEQRLFKAELEWTEQDKEALKSWIKESPNTWILSTRKTSLQLQQLLPDFTQMLVIDSLDRWGRKGINPEAPLQRWQF